MNRIYQAATNELAQTTPFKQELFKVCYERKKRKWLNGYSTPVLDRLVFKKMSEVLGGRIRLIISGDAPLSWKTQLFITLCFCCHVSQGYGHTETSGAGTLMDNRKKDLVKLSHGEYVSPGEIESVIFANPNVESICIHASFNQDYVIALVAPNFKNLQQLAKKTSVQETEDKIYSNEKVRQMLLAEIQHFCKGRLLKVEIPQNICICREKWTPARSGEEAMKLKRRNIEKKYKKETDVMYGDERPH